jgi:hypothetical protein
VEEKNLLQWGSVVEAEGAGAEAADGTGSDFENPHAALIHASFGMDGSLGQPEGVNGLLDGVVERFLDGGAVARGCGVDGLLEERAFERIGFVEDGEGAETARGDEPFEREFAALDVFFDLNEAERGVVMAEEFGQFEEAANAAKGGDELRGRAGADDATAARQAEWLEDAGEDGVGAGLGDIGVEGDGEEARNGEFGAGEPAAGEVLVAGGLDGFGQVEGEVEAAGDVGGGKGWLITHGDNAGHSEEGLLDAAGGLGGLVEFEGEGVIVPGVVHTAAAVGGEDGLEAEARSGFGEEPGLVAERGGNDENLHCFYGSGWSGEAEREPVRRI